MAYCNASDGYYPPYNHADPMLCSLSDYNSVFEYEHTRDIPPQSFGYGCLSPLSPFTSSSSGSLYTSPISQPVTPAFEGSLCSPVNTPYGSMDFVDPVHLQSPPFYSEDWGNIRHPVNSRESAEAIGLGLHLLSPSASATIQMSDAFDSDSDQDVEANNDQGERSDEDEDEDAPEYSPSPQLSLNKGYSHHRAKARVTSRSSRRTLYTSTQTRTPSCRPIRSTRPHAKACSSVRNTSVSYKRRSILGNGEPIFDSVDLHGNLLCLTYLRTFRRDRDGDFKRHVYTHYPAATVNMAGATACCGVPLALRDDYYVPEDAQIGSYYGMQMVGGCGKTFSRTDSLRRHINNRNICCVGDLNGDWHPPKVIEN
ncbi:hypothetical protein BDW22DRAFT_923317 [Trametopsis cervina]|nr:hypothetical protein BDW22DRAFT_923317 [Trametopsis cervina]